MDDDLFEIFLYLGTYFLVFLGMFVCVRVIILMYDYQMECFRAKVQKPPVKTMIVLGSGGHTKEMLTLVGALSLAYYTPRIYVVAHSDGFSKVKAIEFEVERGAPDDSYSFEEVHRIREVGQSWITTLLISLPISAIQCIICVFRHRPNFVLCNGPGICVPILYTSWLLRHLCMLRGHSTYVESICRVNKLSLTGRLVRKFVDHFIVQWMELKEIYKDSVFLGRLS